MLAIFRALVIGCFLFVATHAVAAETEPKLAYASATIATSLADALGKDQDALAQVSMRILVWWIDVRKDFRKGDRVEIVYEPRAGEEPVVHALWFQSQKLGRLMSAVRYQAKGDAFPRYWDERGEELELRLVDSPIAGYEQVTSLLNDGRHHQGVDFKTPVGTPIASPFDGLVINKNWGRRNGNCLWLSNQQNGIEAKLLHLDHIEKGIAVGSRVKRGQVIATSGNTGHSTAPHLHYQLERGSRVVDPFKIHKTIRTRLSGDDVEQCKSALGRYAGMRMGAS